MKRLTEGSTCETAARGKGVHHTGRRREKRKAGPSPFSNSDALLAQLMISFGWHTLRHNHTTSCQIWRPGSKTPRAANAWASTAAAGRGQTIRALFWVWCSGDVAKSPSQLAASEMGNPTLLQSPAPHSSLLTKALVWLLRGSDWELGLFRVSLQQTQMTAGTLLSAQGRKTKQWSTLTYTKMSSETFFYKIYLL